MTYEDEREEATEVVSADAQFELDRLDEQRRKRSRKRAQGVSIETKFAIEEGVRRRLDSHG